MTSEKNQYSELVQKSPAGCLLLEAGIVQQVNPEAVEIMGIPSGRLLGVRLSELLVPEFEDALDDLLVRAGDHSEAEAVRLAHGLIPLELNVRALADDIVIVGVRSMANEHYYSAIAGGALTHDLATGFPNHYHVLSQLQSRLTSQRGKAVAILGLWVDQLPQIADTHGNRAVQRVVKEVGERLQTRLRAPDMVGRFLDAGFLIMMNSDSASEQLTEIAERLRGEVAFPVELDSRLVSFTASVAVGSLTAQQPSIERILAVLEAAAHRASQGAGNRVDVLAL